MRHEESELQRSCVKWFRYKYSNLKPLLFAVPNGGFRNVREARIMKAEGVVAGVSDLILLLPRQGFHALYRNENDERQAVGQPKGVCVGGRCGRLQVCNLPFIR